MLSCFSTDKHPGDRGGGVRMGTTTVSIEEVRALEGKEEREESILALLGIIGTFLNLFVIVFVYIYTTLWDGSTRIGSRWRWEAGSNRDMTAGLTSQRGERGRWHWAARDGESDSYSWPLTPGGYIPMQWTSAYHRSLDTQRTILRYDRFVPLRDQSWPKRPFVYLAMGITLSTAYFPLQGHRYAERPYWSNTRT